MSSSSSSEYPNRRLLCEKCGREFKDFEWAEIPISIEDKIDVLIIGVSNLERRLIAIQDQLRQQRRPPSYLKQILIAILVWFLFRMLF